MATMASPVMTYCIFCCKTKPQKVILFKGDTFRKCQEVLAIRKDYKFKYHDIELPTKLDNTQGYHTNCYKYFTALKHKYYEPKTEILTLTNLKIKSEEGDGDTVKVVEVVNRVCFFCGRRQKMRRDIPQYLHAGPKDVFLDRAKNNIPSEYNQQIIIKLENLNADTFFYHSSCRSRHYDRYKSSIKSTESTQWHKRRDYHRIAYKQMCTFVELNVLDQGRSYFLSQLHDEYMRFLQQIAVSNSEGFDPKSFTSQHLEKKLLKRFGKEIKIFRSHKKKIVAPKHVDNADDLLYFSLEADFSDVPIEHVDVGSVSTISCEEHSDSNLDFLPESEQPPIPTFPSIPSAPKDMKSYCRLCLNPVTKVQMICLGDFHDINYPSRTVQFKRNKILQTEMYLRMIKDLMPNFNHDLVFNPVMCNDCSTRLQMASDFVEQCMATQKLIQQFKDTHCPLEGMVSCEDVVYNKSLLQASSEEGPSQPKQRKISSKPSTSKSVAKSKTTVKPSPPVEQPIETGTFPPDEESQPSSEDVNIKVESIDEEEMEFEDKYEISQDEICYVKQEVAEEAPRIKTDVPIKTEPEFPLLPTNSIVKREPCSSVTSDSTVMTDLNSVKRFSTSDVSSDVDQSSSSVHAIDLPLSSDTLISNYCPDIQGVIAPETCISAVNPSAFSSVNSQFENGQNR